MTQGLDGFFKTALPKTLSPWNQCSFFWTGDYIDTVKSTELVSELILPGIRL